MKHQEFKEYKNCEVKKVSDKFTQNRMDFLHPSVRRLCSAAINEAETKYNIQLRIPSNYNKRDIKEASQAYGYGRTEEQLIEKNIDPEWASPEMSKVTDVLPLYDYYFYGLAFGIVVKNKNNYTNKVSDEIKQIFYKYGFKSRIEPIGIICFYIEIDEMTITEIRNKYVYQKNGKELWQII